MTEDRTMSCHLHTLWLLVPCLAHNRCSVLMSRMTDWLTEWRNNSSLMGCPQLPICSFFSHLLASEPLPRQKFNVSPSSTVHLMCPPLSPSVDLPQCNEDPRRMTQLSITSRLFMTFSLSSFAHCQSEWLSSWLNGSVVYSLYNIICVYISLYKINFM